MPPFVSEPPSSFDRLHPEIRRWIREQGWDELREIQDRSIETILGSDKDLIIAASTAAGKTEAAFLPLLTQAAARTRPGLSVVYVSPLKALINDQFRRLDFLCERLEIDVVRWHGDAPQSAKRRTLRDPGGVALITPESIEALFLRRTDDARRLFADLDAVLIDELHAFLQGPRGLHLASLLRRIDLLAGRRVRRIGLSATLGDLELAARWLNPQTPEEVDILEAGGGAPELRLQIRGYTEPGDGADEADDLEVDGGDKALDHIADHAFGVLRGDNNLFFGNSRRSVEALADRLRRRSEGASVPNEFFPHHGSLSKELREELEARLKAGRLPTTAIATTTLELGIDLGSVKSVAQLGAPRSLASLRQRLGRSGRRRGTPAILRIYTREQHLRPDSDPLDRIRPEVTRAVASIRLLLARFVEPPVQDPAVITVIIHQLLSVIVERGGARADVLFHIVCGEGPLSVLPREEFVTLLRWLAQPDQRLIEQSPAGLIMLGEEGEAITRGREFYAVFKSDQEWRLVAGGRTLGTIPISNMLGVGSLLAFAGRRWRIVDVDDRAKVLEVSPHATGRLPKFDRLSVERIHDRLAAEMRVVYLDDDTPNYVDALAADLLKEGRTAFRELDLADRSLVPAGRDTHLLSWRGTAMNGLIAATLTAAGLECEAHDLGVSAADVTPDEIGMILKGMSEPPSIDALSQFVATLQDAKYDDLAPPDLLRRHWVRRHAHLHQELSTVLLSLRG